MKLARFVCWASAGSMWPSQSPVGGVLLSKQMHDILSKQMHHLTSLLYWPLSRILATCGTLQWMTCLNAAVFHLALQAGKGKKPGEYSKKCIMPVTDRCGRQVAGIYQAFPTHQVVYTLEWYVRGKWACCGERHTRASHAKHTDDVRVYWASSDKIAPGAIPAVWRLLTAWKSPQCVQVYKNVLEFGYRLALATCLLPASVCNWHKEEPYSTKEQLSVAVGKLGAQYSQTQTLGVVCVVAVNGAVCWWPNTLFVEREQLAANLAMTDIWQWYTALFVTEIASVIAAYQATGPEQLSLQPGQLIQVRKKSASGWWEGELQVRTTSKCMALTCNSHTQHLSWQLSGFLSEAVVVIVSLKDKHSGVEAIFEVIFLLAKSWGKERVNTRVFIS